MPDNPPPLPGGDIGFPDLWFTTMKTFGMLFIVLALIIIVLYILKKFMEKKGAIKGQSAISVLAAHYISPKEKLLLIDVLGEKMLIGVTPQAISFLYRIESNVAISIKKSDINEGFFETLLKKNMRMKGRNDPNDRKGLKPEKSDSDKIDTP